jgi:hypothetical protein
MNAERPWLTLPGLFHRVEFESVIDVEHEFYVEEGGNDQHGVAVYRIYFRPHDNVPPSSAPALATHA